MHITSVQEAVKAFTKEFPDMKVIGYWKTSDGYVLDAREIDPSDPPIPIPGQFVVEPDGIIRGTNPVLMDLDDGDYFQI